MTKPCRLCLGLTSVNTYIFGNTRIHLKISFCLPVQISKDDGLPEKICDSCFCKVEEFHKFCNNALDAQKRLILAQKYESKEISNVVNQEIDAEFPPDSTTNDTQLPKYAAPIVGDANCKFLIPDEIKQEPNSSLQEYAASITANTNGKLLKPDEIKHESNPPSPVFCNIIDDVEVFDNFHNESFDVFVKDEDEDRKSDENEYKTETVTVRKRSKIKRVKNKTQKSSKSITKTVSEEEDNKPLYVRKKKRRKRRSSYNGEEIVIKDEFGDRIEPTTDSDVSVDDHENLEPDEEDLSLEWNCCICDFQSNTQHKMLSHYKIHYKSPFAYQNMVSKAEGKLEKQLKLKIKRDSFTCAICEKVFKSSKIYSKHLGKHVFDRPYVCAICEKSFPSPTEILEHGRKFHENGKKDHPANKLGGKTDKMYMCDLCDELFANCINLINHRTYHPKSAEQPIVFPCPICRREYTIKNSFLHHYKTHIGRSKILCNVCGKKLSSRDHLRLHMRIHTGYKPYICKTCKKSFISSCRLKEHERIHTGSKPYKCSHCDKGFSQKTSCVIHERIHTGDRPYKCRFCDRGFVSKGTLSGHLKRPCVK